MANVRASTLYRLATSSSNRPSVEARPGLWRDLDRFERRDDTWRIADRKVVFDLSCVGDAEPAPFPEGSLAARRDQSDPV